MQIKTGIIEPYTKNRIQDGGCGCMDENTAWKNFVNTGKVSDYLAYCRIKLGYPAETTAEDSDEGNEKEDRGNRIGPMGRRV